MLINDGSFGPLQIFTLFLAGIVVFRVTFASIYVGKWKWRYCCNKKYRVQEYNLEKVYSKMRQKQQDDNFSSDDEDIYQLAKNICAEHDLLTKTIPGAEELTERERLERTIDILHDQTQADNSEHVDKDYMRNDLADAGDEELEDRLVETSQQLKRPLLADEALHISRRYNFEGNHMNNSVLSGILLTQDVNQLRASNFSIDPALAQALGANRQSSLGNILRSQVQFRES